MDIAIEMYEVAGTCCICLCDIEQSKTKFIELHCCRNNIHTFCFLEYCANLSDEKVTSGIECPLCRANCTQSQFRQLIRYSDFEKYNQNMRFSNTFLEMYYPAIKNKKTLSIRHCTMLMFLLIIGYIVFISVFILIIEYFR